MICVEPSIKSVCYFFERFFVLDLLNIQSSTMKLNRLLIAAACAGTFIIACKKESENSTLHIRLTDAPAELEEVNVDLKQVNVKMASDTSSWVSLETHAGVYNLLGLQNGVDTLIATGTFPTGTVKEIRLVLGEENTIKSGGQTYPLTIPSGSESGLKIKISKELRAGLDSLIIDFDAGLSVKEEQDGFKLRPVVKVKE